MARVIANRVNTTSSYPSLTPLSGAFQSKRLRLPYLAMSRGPAALVLTLAALLVVGLIGWTRRARRRARAPAPLMGQKLTKYGPTTVTQLLPTPLCSITILIAQH